MKLETNQVETLYKKIKASETIIIHRHKRPDPDAIGSQLGLKYLIEGVFPRKRVLAAGTTTNGLAWLGNMDTVHAEDYQNALVIVVDTANQPRIDGDLFASGVDLVKIDHHPVVDEYGSLQIVHTDASSCSEIITAISVYLQERLPLNAKAARVLYAGIVGDTGRFLYKSTTAHTHRMTAALCEQNIDAFAINDRFQVVSLAELKLQAYAYETIQVNEDGVASLTITRDDLMRFGVSEEQTNSLVNLASRIEGVYCWVTFVEQESDKFFYRCRIRSKGPVINGIAQNHNGGGHPMASGADAYSVEEMQAIVSEMSVVSKAYQENRMK